MNFVKILNRLLDKIPRFPGFRAKPVDNIPFGGKNAPSGKNEEE
jgi:hypothetical protein